MQRTQLTGDDLYEEVQHKQQAYEYDTHYGVTQTVEAAEDIALGAHDSHAAASLAQRLVEHIAVLIVDGHTLHTLLAALHGVAQCGHSRVGSLHSLGEDSMAGNLGCIGMHKICSASAYHDTI